MVWNIPFLSMKKVNLPEIATVVNFIVLPLPKKMTQDFLMSLTDYKIVIF